MPQVEVGTSGWSHDHWDGLLYPEGLPRSQRFDHYETTLVWVSSRRMPRDFTITSDLVYARLHGLEGRYAHDYTREELVAWVDALKIGRASPSSTTMPGQGHLRTPPCCETSFSPPCPLREPNVMIRAASDPVRTSGSRRLGSRWRHWRQEVSDVY